jgi:hypothetical protein
MPKSAEFFGRRPHGQCRQAAGPVCGPGGGRVVCLNFEIGVNFYSPQTSTSITAEKSPAAIPVVLLSGPLGKIAPNARHMNLDPHASDQKGDAK